MRQCRRCALYFTDPHGWTALREDETQPSQKLPLPAQLLHYHRNGFGGTGYDASERLELLASVATGRRLLEVGCSWGWFLLQARAYGFDAMGVEPAESPRHIATEELELDVHADLTALRGFSFDLIYVSEALTRENELGGMLRQLSDLLAPGGRILMQVPHFDFKHRGVAALDKLTSGRSFGFTQEFFQRSLSRYGLSPQKFYDGWGRFTNERRGKVRGEQLICLAHRRQEAA